MKSEVTECGCGNVETQPHDSDSKSGTCVQVQGPAPSKKEKRSRYQRAGRVRTPGTRRLDGILLTTHRYRLVDREIIQLLHFTEGGKASTQRVLTQCWASGFLDKLRNRPINSRDVYFISGRARHGLRRLSNLVGEDAAKERLQRPTTIDHALALNNLRARIELSSRRLGLDIDGWRDELDLAELAADGLVPDASFQLVRRENGRDRRAGFLVEAELTPVSRKHWHRRLANYTSFYRSKYEAVFGSRSLRLLVVTRGTGRQPLSILEEAQGLGFTPLRLTTWEEVRQASPASLLTAPIWRKPFDDEQSPLYPALPSPPASVES